VYNFGQRIGVHDLLIQINPFRNQAEGYYFHKVPVEELKNSSTLCHFKWNYMFTVCLHITQNLVVMLSL
jgi:hypothetical protein